MMSIHVCSKGNDRKGQDVNIRGIFLRAGLYETLVTQGQGLGIIDPE
jgi:hypothetical protein